MITLKLLCTSICEVLCGFSNVCYEKMGHIHQGNLLQRSYPLNIECYISILSLSHLCDFVAMTRFSKINIEEFRLISYTDN